MTQLRVKRPWLFSCSCRTKLLPSTLVLTLACSVSFGGALRAAADDDRRTVSYSGSLWLTNDGLPVGDVLAMAEDQDGYLWLGMNTGLVRFDGFQFLPFGARGEPPLPGSNVPALIAGRDRSIWVGYGDVGGVSRLSRNGVEHHPAGADGLGTGRVSTLLEDRSGRIWAALSDGLSVFQDGRWHSVDATAGIPPGEVFSVYEDRAGQVWVGTSAGIYRTTNERGRFELADSRFGFVQHFTEDDGGAIWITDSQQVVRSLDDAVVPQYEEEVRLPTAGWRLARGSDGTVWIAALGGGLLRLQYNPTGPSALIDRPDYQTVIVGSPRSVFRDRQNNIWVGLRGGGLVRLSEAVFRTDVPLEGITNDGVRGLAASPNGDVWVATGHHLHGFLGDTRQVYDVAQTVAMHVDRAGQVWVATAVQVGRVLGDRITPLPVAPGIRLERVVAITTDLEGRPWLCSVDQGLLWWDGTIVAPHTDPAIAGRPCNYLHTDRAGRMWISFPQGGALATRDGGRFHLYERSDGIPTGTPLAISEDLTGAIWIASASSLTRLLNGRFTTIDAQNGLPGNLVPSILDDEQGYLWVGVNRGANIIRLNRREMDAAAVNPAHRIRYAIYDSSDGLQGELHWTSRPGAVRGRHGELWFATRRGLAVIDPRRPGISRWAAAPRIERVVVGNRAIVPDAQVALPHASSLRIDYSAPNISAGSKFRFRYLLEGQDPEWVEAGSSRQVTYDALPAGNYRFRVTTTGGGEWNGTEAVWSFVVRPPFYQTSWFYGAAVIGVAFCFWTYSRLRLLAVRRRFSLIVSERTRVSREIHDTLLQSLAGVGLELEAVAREIDPSQERSREALRSLRHRVGRCIREARQSISELRAPGLDGRSLIASLRDLADDVNTAGAVDLKVNVSGRRCECGHEVAHHLLRIAQEATHNAIRHGAPRHVIIELEFERRSVTLRVSDDGTGFNPNAPSQDGASGVHWGLVSMTERAGKIGGALQVTSAPGRGTVIEARVPLES